MSSSGECELDGESLQVHVSVTKMNESGSSSSVSPSSQSSVMQGKKVVYTRKKSTSGMYRKISGDNGMNKGQGKEDGIAAGVSSAAVASGIATPVPTTDTLPSAKHLLSPIVLPQNITKTHCLPHHKHHHHHHHHHHHQHHHQSSSTSLRKHVLSRRSPSPSATMSPGYEQYQMALLEVPLPRDYSEASSDDLSSEWDSDAPDSRSCSMLSLNNIKPSGWRKLRNIVQWTPFFQTYKKQRYPWVQLAGHQGNFKAGPDQGTVLKKLCPKEELCFQFLMKDVLRPYVPEYKGQITSEDGESVYLQLQDLLSDFYQPCVMDCKVGVRTYLEEELSKAKEKPKLRKDMYEKMIQIDPMAPTDEEHRAKGVTKPRYMVWRETISSTATLGFRIEGIKKADGTSSKDFKTTKLREQIMNSFRDFTEGFSHAIPKYIQRLKAIRATLGCSQFFQTHEVIGSSLLFVHDRTSASIWLIDFAKTISLPENVTIDHNSKWTVGNHEDGYLIGINNLIEIFSDLLQPSPFIAQSQAAVTNVEDPCRDAEAKGDDVAELRRPIEDLQLININNSKSRSSSSSNWGESEGGPSADDTRRDGSGSGLTMPPSIIKTNSTQQILILDNNHNNNECRDNYEGGENLKY